MLHAKIHRATITDKCVEYQGSITIDADLIDAAGIAVHEKVLVANVSTGERIETYAIEGPRGSGRVALNGAAARLAEAGDLVIVMAFALVDDSEIAGWEPKVVQVDKANRPMRTAAGKKRK